MSESYIHKDWHNNQIFLPIGKVVCVGRNYLEHIEELHNQVPEAPVIFIKCPTSLCDLSLPIALPNYSNNCQHEVELAVLIHKKVSKNEKMKSYDAIWGYGLALDLTLRDIQNRLKEKSLPWEMAKTFDNACPTSKFIPKASIPDPQNLDFTLMINGKIKQKANAQQMIHPIESLINYISNYFTLLPGDIVLTGTPSGVGPLHSGDKIECTLDNFFTVQTIVR